MPTNENDRRNLQQPVLEKPSLPDHDRTQDEGMRSALPEEFREEGQERVPPGSYRGQDVEPGNMDDNQLSPPDQEFGQVLESGHGANQGRIPDDPNNWLTSDPESSYEGNDPENRGESLPDYLERDKH